MEIKKNRHSLLWAIVFFALAFITGWKINELFDNLFVFALLVYPVLFVLFIICLVKIARDFKADRSAQGGWALAILILTVFMGRFFPFEEVRLQYDYKFLTPMRQEVVDKIASGEIDDSSHLINLPLKYSRVSSDSTVYVYQNDEDGIEVGFWVFRGMLSGSKIVMYADGGEEQIRSNEDGHPVVLVESLGGNWYYVETDY